MSFPIEQVMERLLAEKAAWGRGSVTEIAEAGRDPFRVLVSTILSLRTKDSATLAASRRLFAVADTPAGLLALEEAELARLIHGVGFYKTKARTLREISRRLIEERGGRVPDDLNELLAYKGVGRKTANLVITMGYGLPGICVDVHVHRICNRWGYIRTKTPDATEMRLRARLPERYWIPINDLLVTFGQAVCRPVSPHCSRCPVAGTCRRVGVGASR